MAFLTGPEPPNPATTASAQTGTNISTAIANSFLNNPNQVTQQGNLTYTPSGDSITLNDPANPGVQYTIPRYQVTQTLNEPYASTENYGAGAKLRLAGLGYSQAGKLQDILGRDVSLDNAPALGDPNTIRNISEPSSTFADAGAQQTSISGYGQPSTTFGTTPGSIFGFGDAGGITRSYGPQDNFSADRARVEQSLFERVNPQLDRQRQQIQQQLADQGIRYGSPAYTAAMDDFNRQANDMRLAITAQGGQEQQRLADMAAKQAGFQNAAQMQEYQQQQGRGQFYNAAEQQAFAEAQARGQFGNAAQQALYEQMIGAGQFRNAAQAAAFQQAQARGQFGNAAIAQQLAQRQAALNAQNQTRNQYLSELYAQRNQPINEISALLSGSQLSQPQWANWNQAQIPTTDIAGLINQNFAQQSANAQMQSQLFGNILGAAGNIGTGLALRSDRKVKENIHRIGTVFSATEHPVEEPTSAGALADDEPGRRKRLPIYSYSYKDDPTSTRHVGPMAQDVEKTDPGAVTTIRGVKHIDPKRVMGSILRAA